MKIYLRDESGKWEGNKMKTIEKGLKIKSISLEFPNCDDGSIIFYEVGKTDVGGKIVTEIKKAERCGEMAMIPYYEIYTENGLHAEMHQYGHIVYEEEK